jgi:predicted O-methyltransferase YrrM
MIPNIRNFTKDELLNWLRTEAGVNHPTWFGTNLKQGNLEIQQVPEEYIEYLWFLKNANIKKYLNIGVGKGGSFMLETYIQPNLELSVAVDNSSYWHTDQTLAILDKISWIQSNSNCVVEFYDSDSVKWLKSNWHLKFDAIFIDGDHSYDGLKNDYVNSLPLLNNNGYVIFHDINSHACPGVVQIWNELKNNSSIEFIKSETCGIGIIQK